MEKTRKYLSVYDLAERYSVHPSSVWRWVSQGKFPLPVKIGGSTRWQEKDIVDYEEEAQMKRA